MKLHKNRFLASSLFISLSLLPSAHAADGTWINVVTPTVQIWSTAANWSGGTVADGSGSTANFSTVDITGLTTVRMDTPRTLTALTFGDTTPSNHGWSIGNGSNFANILTLAGTNPSITVGALGTGDALINLVMSGTTGWSKLGAGTLRLAQANTYNAPTTIGAGTLSVNTINSIGALTGSALGQPTTAANGQINIRRSGTLLYTGGNVSSDRNFNIDTNDGVNFGNATINNSSTTAGSTLTLSGTISTPAGPGTAGNLILRGSRNITVDGEMNLGINNLLKTDGGVVTLTNASNDFTGFVRVANGSLSASSIAAGGVASALGAGTQIQLGESNQTGRLIYTGTGDVTDRTLTLSGTTGGGIIRQSGTGLLKFTSDSTVTGSGAKTLTFEGSTAGTGEFAGTIIDSGGGATAVTKTGTGTWTLSAATNTYTGTTTISGGTLVVNGNISTSTTNVQANGTLAGIGTVGGVTVGANGTLAIGSSPGTMTFTGDLGLSADSISNFEINDFTLGNYDLAKAATADTQTVGFNGGTLNLLFQSGFNTTGSVTIFDFDDYNGTGFTSVVSTGLAAGYTASFDAANGMVTVIPEPNAAALLGSLGMLALLRRRRGA